MCPEKKYISHWYYGQSMFPTLRHEDRILIKRVSPSEIKVRQIIIYENGSSTVCHRVVRKEGRLGGLVFYIRGDYNCQVEKIKGNRILGKIEGIERNGKLKFLSFENNLIYCLFINVFSLFKELLKRSIEKIYSFALFRKIIKFLFPVKIDYQLVEDIQHNANFKSFYNFSPSLLEKYSYFYGFVAACKNNPVGKLWVLNDEEGNWFLYGPYVKVLYRARNIGSSLLKKAIGFLQSKQSKGYIYALILPNRALLSCLKKLGFTLEKREGLFFLKRKQNV